MRNEYDTGASNSTSGIKDPSNDWWRRGIRTFLQALVGGGGLTLLVDQLVADLPTAYDAYVLIFGAWAAAMLQNYAEQQGWVKPLLKAKPAPRG